VERDFNTILNDERTNEILASCSTADLIGFKRVLAKLINKTSTPLIEVQSGGDLEGVLDKDDVEGKDQDLEQSLMRRTRWPKGEGEDIETNKEPQLDSRDQLNAEEAGGEEVLAGEITSQSPPPPPREKWRPRVPVSLIHFESGVAMAAHLYGRKKKRK
jgi:hypothetical protein